jgi:predicted RNA-binding protein YlqC (UPF0109 family)
MRNAPVPADGSVILVQLLARAVAERPDAVSVSEQDDSGVHTVSIHADPVDRGRIIGRNGRTIRAIRVLSGIAAGAANRSPARVNVEC